MHHHHSLLSSPLLSSQTSSLIFSSNLSSSSSANVHHPTAQLNITQRTMKPCVCTYSHGSNVSVGPKYYNRSPGRWRGQLSVRFNPYGVIFIYMIVWVIDVISSVFVCLCMCVCTYVCVYVCMYVCMHVCMYVCMYVCSYVCMYVSMCVCESSMLSIGVSSVLLLLNHGLDFYVNGRTGDGF